MKKENLGCLLFYVIIGGITIFSYLYVQKTNTRYLVEETGYFHSTNNEEECRFIKSAHEHDYTIKKIDKKDPLQKGYKICKECYSLEDQAVYNKAVQEEAKFKRSLYDGMEWSYLKYKSVDYSKLYVYIDKDKTLHLNGSCGHFFGKEIEAERVPFTHVRSFNTTCKDCVDAGLVEFIYKAINEGVYDKDLIRDEDN